MQIADLLDRRNVSHTTRYLTDLGAMAERGELALPKFQRPFVWTDADIAAMLDSIAQGFPIGTVILWGGWWSGARVPPDRVRAFEGHALRERPTLVLDGQQRLTALLRACSVGTRWVVDLRDGLVFRMGTDAELADPIAALRSCVFPAWMLATYPHDGPDGFLRGWHDAYSWATPCEYDERPRARKAKRKGVIVDVPDGFDRVRRDLPQTPEQRACAEAVMAMEGLRSIFRGTQIGVTEVSPYASLDFAREVFRRFNASGRPMSADDVFNALAGDP